MFKSLVSITALSVLMLATAPQARAGEVFNPYGHFGHPSEISGGVYFKVPFNGGLRGQGKQEARVGFAFTLTTPQNYQYSLTGPGFGFQGSQKARIPFLDLSFGLGKQGFKRLKVNNFSIADIKKMAADEDGEKKSKTGLYVLGILGAGLIVGAIAYCSGGQDIGPVETSNC